jgi:hypothetical protein
LTELKNLGFEIELITSALCDGGETEPAVRMADCGRPHRHRRRRLTSILGPWVVVNSSMGGRKASEMGKASEIGNMYSVLKKSVFYVRTWVPAITICLVVVRISNNIYRGVQVFNTGIINVCIFFYKF